MISTGYKIGDLVIPYNWDGNIVQKNKIYIVRNHLEVIPDKGFNSISLIHFGHKFRKVYKNEKDRYNKYNPWL